MDVIEIPYNAFLGITSGGSPNSLRLKMTPELQNHLGAMHAGAQYSLAEACSGLYLLQQFPDLADKVVPVVRSAQVKYRKPAEDDIVAEASADQTEIDRFTERFSKKGRATITVNIAVKDPQGNTAMAGAFEWFVQQI